MPGDDVVLPELASLLVIAVSKFHRSMVGPSEKKESWNSLDRLTACDSVVQGT